MFILQNIYDFVNNPMGRGSNAIPSRQLIKDDLNRRFAALFENKDKKIELDIYKDGQEYYFHFKIPSESKKRKNTYDVVLQFTIGENAELASDKNIKRYDVKFFSNSPSFTYTYAYAFNMYGMMVDSLANKFRKLVLDNPPITRNPGEIISYEKTIYFAAYYLLENDKYLSKIVIDAEAKPYRASDLSKKIRTTDVVELEIKKERARVDSEQREQEKRETKRDLGRRGQTVARKDKVVVSNKKSSGSKTKKITPKKSSINKIKPR